MDFLTSFWAALDGRALNRAVDATLFLNSLLECLVLLIRRSRVAGTETGETPEACGESDALKLILVAQERAWSEVASGRLGSEDAAGTALSRTLMSILSISSSKWPGAYEFSISRFPLFSAVGGRVGRAKRNCEELLRSWRRAEEQHIASSTSACYPQIDSDTSYC